MLQEIKAEIFKLMVDLTFVRNLSFISLIAIASLCGLSELQSQNREVTEHSPISSISRPTFAKIIVEHK